MTRQQILTEAEHNALELIKECAENSFKPDECQLAINYIMGIMDMVNSLKEVVKE